MTNTVLEREATGPSGRNRSRASGKALALSGLALAIAFALAWYGYYWWTVGRFTESTDDAYVGGNVTPISPHVAGFVAEILVGDNQKVSAGQLLIRLDPRDFQAALDHARAVAHQRDASLAGLRAKYASQQSAIRRAEADLLGERAKATFAALDAVRYRTIARAGAGSEQSAQRALALDQEARSTVSSSEAALAEAQQQLAVLDAAISEAEAAVAQAHADLQTARLNLAYTEIRAPIDGYVGNRAAQTGAYVSAGAYLLSLVPAHGLWVDANFKEDQLARMRPGQAAVVTTDELPGHPFAGHVLSLAPGTGAIFSVIPPENATGNFTKIVQRVPVRIELNDDDVMVGRLRPGLSTTVTVETRSEARDGK